MALQGARSGPTERIEAEQAARHGQGPRLRGADRRPLDGSRPPAATSPHPVGDQAPRPGARRATPSSSSAPALAPASAEIAFDPKDNQLSKDEAWESSTTLWRPGRGLAVLVVATEDQRVPPRRETLAEYEGNKLILAVDREDPERNLLEAAYGIARARALAARQDELALDAPAMKEAIDEARRALESLKTARQALTGVRKNADSIESTLAAMEEGAKAALARADSLIADALESAAQRGIASRQIAKRSGHTRHGRNKAQREHGSVREQCAAAPGRGGGCRPSTGSTRTGSRRPWPPGPTRPGYARLELMVNRLRPARRRDRPGCAGPRAAATGSGRTRSGPTVKLNGATVSPLTLAS